MQGRNIGGSSQYCCDTRHGIPHFCQGFCATLGHTWYYNGLFKFMRRLLHHWRNYCTKIQITSRHRNAKEALDTLKEKFGHTSILVFPYWSNIFHVHVNASSISLGGFSHNLGEGNIDHPVYFSSHNLSDSREELYNNEHEGLAMVYALQKFQHYFLGTPFKFFTDHSTLKYLVNNQCWGGGGICQWIFLFQEFEFEVVVKLRKI
jgi:hypothetical protein